MKKLRNPIAKAVMQVRQKIIPDTKKKTKEALEVQEALELTKSQELEFTFYE